MRMYEPLSIAAPASAQQRRVSQTSAPSTGPARDAAMAPAIATHDGTARPPPAQERKELFVRAVPNLQGALLPAKWLWRWSRRRFGSSSALDKSASAMATLLAEGITYGEAPRFRLAERKLYYVDSYANCVRRYDVESHVDELFFRHDDYVSGLGWLPDGRFLVVSMKTQKLLVVDPETRQHDVYADLAHVVRSNANDMVVSASGRAYIGNFGFDLSSLQMYTTTLIDVAPDRSVRVAATGMFFPNGSVITPDGKTLIISETFGARISAFDIDPADGSLSNRRVWADVNCPVDGMCLDAEGCVWVAVPQIGLYKTSGALLRVREGGEILSVIGFGSNGVTQSVFACQLGTDSTGTHHLYFLEARTSDDRVVLKNGLEEAKKNGVLKRIEVPVGPATMPDNPNYCGGYC